MGLVLRVYEGFRAWGLGAPLLKRFRNWSKDDLGLTVCENQGEQLRGGG